MAFNSRGIGRVEADIGARMKKTCGQPMGCDCFCYRPRSSAGSKNASNIAASVTVWSRKAGEVYRLRSRVKFKEGVVRVANGSYSER